jgi:hypothetical protein
VVYECASVSRDSLGGFGFRMTRKYSLLLFTHIIVLRESDMHAKHSAWIAVADTAASINPAIREWGSCKSFRSAIHDNSPRLHGPISASPVVVSSCGEQFQTAANHIFLLFLYSPNCFRFD